MAPISTALFTMLVAPWALSKMYLDEPPGLLPTSRNSKSGLRLNKAVGLGGEEANPNRPYEHTTLHLGPH